MKVPRLRRLLVMIVWSLVLSACSSSVGTQVPPRGVAPSAGADADGVAAFHGLGKLALVKEGRLYLLDGATDTLRTVEGAEPTSAPVWSADGRWVAFHQGDGHVMVAEAATGALREVTGLPGPASGFAWAPEGATLAVAVTPETGPSQLLLIDDPSGLSARELAEATTPMGDLAWSPDGQQIAYVTTLPYQDPLERDDALRLVQVSSGKTSDWLVADNAGIDLAGWAPDGSRILFWRRPMHCVSCAADGRPLESLALGARQPVSLSTTLLNREWLAWAPGGQELLLVSGGGRIVWDQKKLAVCSPAGGACRDLPQPEAAVRLDPTWAPDGKRIAFVQAERRPGQLGFTDREELAAWVKSRSLWVSDPDGANDRQLVAAGAGVYSPAWAADGRHLLYIRENAVWVIDVDAGTTARVIDLGGQQDLLGFYGQLSWWHRLAWYRQ